MKYAEIKWVLFNRKWRHSVCPYLFQAIFLETSLNSAQKLVSDFSEIEIWNCLLFYCNIINALSQNVSPSTVPQWKSFDTKHTMLYDERIFVHVTAEIFFQLLKPSDQEYILWHLVGIRNQNFLNDADETEPETT
jgi:F0F1-type ATP synthase gamma subunit